MTRYLLGAVTLAAGLAVSLGPASAQEKKGKKEEVKLTADEKALVDLLNKERAKAKLPPLKVSPLLTKIARAHSANMAKHDKMTHERDGKNPAKRATEGGYDWKMIGENVGYGESEGEPVPPAEIHAGWMKSKIHKDNILK